MRQLCCLVFFMIFAIHLVKCSINTVLDQYGEEVMTYSDYLITFYAETTAKPCLYFSDARYSQPEYNLINCTWYKENSCCKRTEVASVFSSMFTLNTESKTCMDLMNYMMCYFCSPNQYIWYRNSKVSVCSSFCNKLYDDCKKAEYGGKMFEDHYKDGKQFCEAQNFEVIEYDDRCFDFDPEVFSGTQMIKIQNLLISSCSLSIILVFMIF